jgi:F420-dependent oxidoreductase-like protein
MVVMELRIFTEPQQGASYDDLLRIAQATEELGFDAFFRSDHYLAMGDSDGLPGPSDAWVSLAGLARETSRIRLGTLVSPATFREPGPLAITVAQVDQMSGGRIELGLGAGWYEAEHSAYGLGFPDVGERFDRFEEQLEIVTGLWATPIGETFSHSGAHYSLTDSPGLPKPAQHPGPPIIIGGGGKRRTPALAVQYATEFNVAFRSVEDTRAAFDRVLAGCDEAGRDRSSMVLSVGQVLCAGRDESELDRRADSIGREVDELRESGFAGTPAEVVDRIGAFTDMGATRVYLQVLDLTDIDHLQLVADEVAPQLT